MSLITLKQRKLMIITLPTRMDCSYSKICSITLKPRLSIFSFFVKTDLMRSSFR